ncbi:MAG TPA: HAD family hydrolase [Solirubrobacteraceae bacterium]|nr:HAD family hydrolase [Solirubrobacteraceae bacterium]
MGSSPVRAVLFDLDGTLMDHDSAREIGARAQLTAWLGEGATEEERARLQVEWARLEALHYDEYASGACSMQEHRRRRVRGMHVAVGREQPGDEAADTWFGGYLKHYRASWRPFEDALPALQALAGTGQEVRLGVVTNGEGESQRAKLRAIGLEDRFATVVASGEVGVAKPRAEIFALACERLGVDPSQAAHVGDRLDLDAEGAAAAGLRGVWLDRLGAGPGPGHVLRIATLHELPAALSAR